MRQRSAILAAGLLLACSNGPGPKSETFGSGMVILDRSGGLLADGMDAATITVRVLNGAGGPLQGVPVVFHVSGSDNKLSTENGTTNDAGEVVSRLTTTRAETKSLIVNLPNTLQGISLTGAPPITFIAGRPQGVRFSVPPTTVEAGAHILPAPTVVVEDVNGNAVDLEGKSITITLGNSVSGTLSGTTTVASVGGVATFVDLSVDKAADGYVLVAAVDDLHGTSPEFSVVGGTAAKLAFVGAPRNAVAGGLLSNVVVAREDSAGNILPEDALVTVSVSGSAMLGGTKSVTTVHGVAAFTDLHLELAGTYTLTAKASVFLSATSDSFTVLPGAPDGTQSFFSTFDTSVIADGTSVATLRLIVRDAWSNLVPNLPVHVSATGGAVAATAGEWKTDSAGALLATVKSTHAGDSLVSADLGNGVVLTTLIHFLPGPVSLEHSSLVATPETVSVDALTTTLRVTARDASGNALAGLPITLASNGAECRLFSPAASGVTDALGVFQAALSCTHAEEDTITATLGDAGDLTTQVTFVTGTPAPTVMLNPMRAPADGATRVNVRVRIADSFGNPVSGATVHFSATGSNNTLQQPSITDASGWATGWLTSTAAGEKTLTVDVDAGEGAFQLEAHPVATFRDSIFAPAVQYATGQGSFWTGLGDLDGDGKLDAVVTNQADGTLSVLLGNGDGTFADAVSWPSGAAIPVCPLIGCGPSIAYGVLVDVDGDADLDIVVSGPSLLSVLRNDGHARFSDVTTYPLSFWPEQMIATDLSGDGKPDLIISDYSQRENATTDTAVAILLNDGNGAFGTPAFVTVGANPWGLAWADFTGDAAPDLAVATQSGGGAIVVLPHRSGPAFLDPVSSSAPPAISLLAADFNLDGRLDVVTGTCLEGPSLHVLRGRGDGTFESAASYDSVAFSGSYCVEGLGAPDLDGDHSPDLVASHLQGNLFVALLNNGDGTFGELAKLELPGRGLGTIAMGDLNGDGAPDVVVAEQLMAEDAGHGAMSVLLNTLR